MHHLLHDLLVPGTSLAEKILRPILVYAFLVVALRLAGKRQLTDLSPLDLVVAMTLANALQNAIIGDDNSVTGGMIGGGVLLLLNYLMLRFLYRHRRLDHLIEGEPVPLIEDGQLVHEHMHRELITEEHLLAACHEQGVERFEQVERAILETGGQIAVFPKHPKPEEASIADLARRLAAMERLLRDVDRRVGAPRVPNGRHAATHREGGGSHRPLSAR